MKSIVKDFLNTYIKARSFKTKRNLLIIESDDWGSTRTKNNEFLNYLNAISPQVSKNPYIQYDSIATADDLEALYDVLDSVKDIKGNPACITANVCTANPDFEAIKNSDYHQFYYKPFTKTLEEYSRSSNIFNAWQNGITTKYFVPQLHGREHLHALAWLKELRAGNLELLKAFELEAWGIPYVATGVQRKRKLQAALDIYNLEGEEEFQNSWILDSAKIFEESFGYKATSFIAPSYVWHPRIHKTLKKTGIKSLQGIKLQYIPSHKKKTNFKKVFHHLGQKDKNSNLIYTYRNAFFEPYIDNKSDWAEKCFNDVQVAFKNKQPAIIGSHRINFIGRLDENFRNQNLVQLKRLLQKIIKAYPEVEFITSNQLTNIITA